MNRRSLLISILAGAALIVPGVFIFWPFIGGDAVLLYRDIGSDSLLSYYPDFVHLSDYVRRDGFPSWSFHIGMGQDAAYAIGYLIWEPVCWLPKAWIAHALVYQHLAKAVLAGLIFFRFLQMRGLESPAPLLGALLLSFSAYMTMGSCWYPLADEVICFAAVLLGVEQALQGHRWLLLALAVALIGVINPFYLYLCALFLLLYVPMRVIGEHGLKARQVLPKLIALAAVAFLGVFLGAIFILPYLEVVLNSPRGSGALSAEATLRSFPLFGFESRLHYVTAILRTFANDAIGAAKDFRGWANYLEAPLNYCGLISVLLIPQAFIGVTARQRIIYGLCLAGAFLLTTFPWFRYLFWLFEGDYYRTFSLFCALLAITLSLSALSRYVHSGAFNSWLLAATTVALVAILFLPLEELRARIDPALRFAAVAYLMGYGAILIIGQLLKQRRMAAWLIVVLAAIELVHFNRLTVSHRDTVKKSELIGGVAADNANPEALTVIKRDPDPFFRAIPPAAIESRHGSQSK